MKWTEILRKNDVALLQNETDTGYVVATGYDSTQPENSQWAHGNYFCYWDNEKKANSLADALDYFRYKTETNYISRPRLEELATLFKDGLVSDDEDSAIEYFENTCEMTDKEKEFFGIDTMEVK